MQIGARWQWAGDEASQDYAWYELTTTGTSWIHAPEIVAGVEADPRTMAEALLGRYAFRMIPGLINPLAGPPRGYEGNSQPVPLHVEPHAYLSAHVMILMCIAPAFDGGDTLLVDGWELVNEIKASQPVLFRSLFQTPRMIPFAQTTWVGPTVSLRMESLQLVHGIPEPRKGDAVGIAFADIVRRAKPSSLRLGAGDVLLVNNHRMLHGRTAFTDQNRRLARCNVWLQEPMSAPTPLIDEGRQVVERLDRQLAVYPTWIQHRFGLFGTEGLEAPPFREDYPRAPEATSRELLQELAHVMRQLDLTF